MAWNENKTSRRAYGTFPGMGLGLEVAGVAGLGPMPLIPEVVCLGFDVSFSKMMLQHPGQVSASEVSASAIVPCLSPPGSLVFEDFANLTPFVKEELRFAIQSKHLCHRMSSALESVTVSSRPLEMAVTKAQVGAHCFSMCLSYTCTPITCQMCYAGATVWKTQTIALKELTFWWEETGNTQKKQIHNMWDWAKEKNKGAKGDWEWSPGCHVENGQAVGTGTEAEYRNETVAVIWANKGKSASVWKQEVWRSGQRLSLSGR